MCLITHNIKPLVADKDLTVFKSMILCKDGSLRSPFQKFKARYGENMVAKGDIAELPSDYSKREIGKGVIHSFILINNHTFFAWGGVNRVFVKATIKAGTPFFVSSDGEEIASRELLLNSQEENTGNSIEAMEKILKETRKEIYAIVREETVGNGGVRVGDILLSDKSFIVPDKITDKQKKEAIGIVGFIRNDGAPHVIALNRMKAGWTTIKPNTLGYFHYMDDYVYATDFNGKGHTEELAARNKKRLRSFPSLQYAVEYETKGTKAGDWYIPSSGEMLQTMRNKFIINITEDILKAYTCRLDNNIYFTSSEILECNVSAIIGSTLAITYLIYSYFAYVRLALKPLD